jgi:hypothetical protein
LAKVSSFCVSLCARSTIVRARQRAPRDRDRARSSTSAVALARQRGLAPV